MDIVLGTGFLLRGKGKEQRERWGEGTVRRQ